MSETYLAQVLRELVMPNGLQGEIGYVGVMINKIAFATVIIVTSRQHEEVCEITLSDIQKVTLKIHINGHFLPTRYQRLRAC